MGLAWNKQMSVGNAVIDSGHKYLIGIANNARRAIKARDSFILSQELKRLENWLCIHFINEKRIARVVNFDFSEHKLGQQYALSELQRLRDELATKNGILSDGAVEYFNDFLKNWLIDNYIVRLGMQMKPTLQSHGYTFWPGRENDEINHTAGRTASLYLQL